MTNRPTRAIVLGAGEGQRLRPHTETRPKCLVELEGRSLLDWGLGKVWQKDGTPRDLPSQDSEDDRDAQASEDMTFWWALFDDPVLNELIETAWQENPPKPCCRLRR